jgi:hypothetical protein
MGAHAIIPSAQLATPETYLDAQRQQGFNPPLQAGTRSYPGLARPAVNEFALRGTWQVNNDAATAVSAGAAIQARVQAARVYLVLTSQGNRPRRVGVLLDGRPIGPGQAGADVTHGFVTVRGQRLYALVALSGAQPHDISIEVPPGVSAYDFTFG